MGRERERVGEENGSGMGGVERGREGGKSSSPNVH